MPSYEALFAFKTASKLLGGLSTRDVIKRSILSMMREGAIVTHLKNMGQLKLGDSLRDITHGHFFIVQCELPTQKVETLADLFQKDADIIRFTTTELPDVEIPPAKCSGSVAHLVLNPELHDYEWNFEGNLMRQVPRNFESMVGRQTKSTLRGHGVNEILDYDSL